MLLKVLPQCGMTDAKMVRREVQLAGGNGYCQELVHARHMETLSRDVFNDLPDKVNNFFYTANGLGPVTVVTKTLDGLVRGHTIIEASIRKATGEASQFEIEFLARYNISDESAKAIADIATRKGSPIEQSNNGLFLPNTEMWDNDYLVDVFRNALRSGVANRVIMAGPADKPIMMAWLTFQCPLQVSLECKRMSLSKDTRVMRMRFLAYHLHSTPTPLVQLTRLQLTAQGAVRSKAMHCSGYGSWLQHR